MPTASASPHKVSNGRVCADCRRIILLFYEVCAAEKQPQSQIWRSRKVYAIPGTAAPPDSRTNSIPPLLSVQSLTSSANMFPVLFFFDSGPLLCVKHWGWLRCVGPCKGWGERRVKIFGGWRGSSAFGKKAKKRWNESEVRVHHHEAMPPIAAYLEKMMIKATGINPKNYWYKIRCNLQVPAIAWHRLPRTWAPPVFNVALLCTK